MWDIETVASMDNLLAVLSVAHWDVSWVAQMAFL